MELTIRIITYAIIVLSYSFSLWLSILNYKNRNAKIPEEVKDIYNEEDYKKWHKYNMANFRFGLIAKTISTVVFVILLAAGYFPFINRLSIDISDRYETQVVLFMGLYYAVTYIIEIFTSYYRTFVIEEKFGFNKTTKSTFVKDKIKNLILLIILGGGLVIGLATLYTNFASLFFIYAYIGLVVIVILSSMLYVKVFVPLFNKLKPLEDSTLKTKIEEFAKSVGYEISKISIMDASKRSSKLNAYFTGFGKFKQIVLYDTLVDKCTEEEVVAVLAHEIGHNKYKHMWTGFLQTIIMLSIYVGFLVLLLEVPVFSTAFGFTGSNFGFALVLFTVLMTPIMIPIEFLTAYISRKHEYQADNYAASNYSKEHMESSLKVLTRENFSNLTPHPLFVKMNYSHPPTVDRIRSIRKIK
jgi:STE24 endopeptidase